MDKDIIFLSIIFAAIITLGITEYVIERSSKRKNKLLIKLLELVLIEFHIPTRIIIPHGIMGLCALVSDLEILGIINHNEYLTLINYIRSNKPNVVYSNTYWWPRMKVEGIEENFNEGVKLRIEFIESLIQKLKNDNSNNVK